MDTREIREIDILVEEKVVGVAEEEEKSMGDAESIRNLFEQVGQGGRGSLTIDDLCLSVIAPPLMEKIRDDFIGDKIHINKQTSDELRLVSVSNPNSVSAHSVVLIRRPPPFQNSL